MQSDLKQIIKLSKDDKLRIRSVDGGFMAQTMLVGNYEQSFSGLSGIFELLFNDYDSALEYCKSLINYGFFSIVVKYDTAWLIWRSYKPFWFDYM